MDKKAIGLCLSGGGHRASIFSLGALLYLVDANRHGDIIAVSSVSGGSLTNGFLAVQSKPFHRMTQAQFEDCAASWARQIAGSPAWWWTAFLGKILLFLTWSSLVGASWGWWRSWLARLITPAPSWWEIQVLYLFAVCAWVAFIFVWARIARSRLGGTFWGWWGTWLYLSILLPALFLLIFMWWSPLTWGWRLLMVAIAAQVCALRNRVADLAFRKTVCCGKQLSAIHPKPLHVFCATEMRTGRHAFFSHDFVYSYEAGLGRPADLPLSTAIQMSANFPVAFPYRIHRVKKHNFQLREPGARATRGPLVLSDGGVQDNSGVTWFSEASERNSRLQRYFTWYSEHASHSPPLDEQGLIKRQLDAMKKMEEQSPLLVVVNSSYPIPPDWIKIPFESIPVVGLISTLVTRLARWIKARLHSIPVLGELVALVRVQAVMYDHRAREQSHQLHRQFFSQPLTGTMVPIQLHPDRVLQLFRNRHRREDYTMKNELQELGLSDLPPNLLEYYSERAQTARYRAVFERDYRTVLSRFAEEVREIDKRKQQLYQQKQQARPGSEESERIDDEIRECERQKTSIYLRLKSREAAGGIKILPESEQRRKETYSWLTPTTLRPLGLCVTRDLLRHGYLTCMNMCYLLLDFPLFDKPPTSEDMLQLARGLRREGHRTSAASAATAP